MRRANAVIRICDAGLKLSAVLWIAGDRLTYASEQLTEHCGRMRQNAAFVIALSRQQRKAR